MLLLLLELLLLLLEEVKPPRRTGPQSLVAGTQWGFSWPASSSFCLFTSSSLLFPFSHGPTAGLAD